MAATNAQRKDARAFLAVHARTDTRLTVSGDVLTCDTCEEAIGITSPLHQIEAFISDHDDCGTDEPIPDDDGDRFDGHGDDLEDRYMFADPGGRSALRAATARNPRNQPCPTCGAPDVLTLADRALGYQCDRCADRDEGGGYGRGDY